MPKNKSHKGLLKRIKITKTGKIRFRAPASRHLKSNKTGLQVQSYRKPRYARAGDLRALSKMLFRPLRSEEQHEADLLHSEAEAAEAAAAPKTDAQKAAQKAAEQAAEKAAKAAAAKAAEKAAKKAAKRATKLAEKAAARAARKAAPAEAKAEKPAKPAKTKS